MFDHLIDMHFSKNIKSIFQLILLSEIHSANHHPIIIIKILIYKTSTKLTPLHSYLWRMKKLISPGDRADCESLIRKMLVLEPGKRYTIPQIKRHRWMAGAGEAIRPVVPTISPSLQEPNEQILRLMHSLGIDIARTREVRSSLVPFISSSTSLCSCISNRGSSYILSSLCRVIW